MLRYRVVARAAGIEPETVLWEGHALDAEDALRQALAEGVRLAMVSHGVIVREVAEPSEDRP